MADDELKAMWDNLSLGYTESAGLPLLREEIASCYAGIETQHVTVLCPEEGIYLGLRALVEEGDEIVVNDFGDFKNAALFVNKDKVEV